MDDIARERWWWVLQRVRAQSPTTEVLLRAGRLESASNGVITISWAFPYHRKMFEVPERRRMVEDTVADVLGARYRLRCILAGK